MQFATMPANFVYIGIYLVRPKSWLQHVSCRSTVALISFAVCCNALLSTLNVREDRNRKNGPASTSLRFDYVVGTGLDGVDTSFSDDRQSNPVRYSVHHSVKSP